MHVSRLAPALAVGVVALVVVGLVVVLFLSQAPAPLIAGQREAATRALARQVSVDVAADRAELAAIRASADFGIEEGVRAVPVRIVESLDLRLRLAVAQDMTLAGLPRVCLVGPFWNPLDAGLSDRCWGEPDLAGLVGGQLQRDAGGAITLSAGTPFELAVSIARSQSRCDYAPGEWRLQIDAPLEIGGVIVDHVELADAPFEVPLEPEGTVLPFHPNNEVRPCSYTAAVYTRQREPLFAR